MKRTLKILGGGAIELGKDYTQNLQSLVVDANSIRASVVQSGKNAFETASKMKSSGLTKRLTDWFYQKDREFDQFDLEGPDDEFDAGFKTDEDMEDDSTSVKIPTLTADSMKDITRGQVSAMYKIGGKQSEISIANTAEIVSSINNRSSEMIASINNINTTMLGLSKQIEKLVDLQSKMIPQTSGEMSNRNNDKDSLYDYYGNLSLAGIFNKAKRSSQDSAIVSMGSMLKDSLSMITPETVVSMVLDNTIAQKKFKAFGNKSIDEIGKKFDETVGAVTQTALSEIIALPMFKKFFGDITKTKEDPDYSKMVTNTYNTKPAVFDGMTRHSIISVIPEYLKKINENLSGQKFDINHKGELTTKTENVFDKTVIRTAFRSSGISYETVNALANDAKGFDTDINTRDINSAAAIMCGIYVMQLHKTGHTSIRPSQISTNDLWVIELAVKMLVNSEGKTPSYWETICLTVLNRLDNNIIDKNNFVTNVNRSLSNMKKNAVDFATNHHYKKQAKKLTFDMLSEQFALQNKEMRDVGLGDISIDELEHEIAVAKKTNPRALKEDGDLYKKKKLLEQVDRINKGIDGDIEIKESSVGQSKSIDSFSMLDYARGIFGILNRGINVRVTSHGRKSRYGNYELQKSTTTQTISDSISDVLGDDKYKDKSLGEQSKGFLKDMYEQLIPKSVRMSMQFFGGKARSLGLIPDKKDISTSDDGDTNNPNISDKIKNLLKPVKNNAQSIGRIVIGDKITNDDGTTTRQNGIVQGVAGRIRNRFSSVKDKTKGFVSNTLDDMIAKRDYNNIQREIKNKVTTDDAQERDKLQAQHIFSLMETAVADGDSGPDTGVITKEISKINDPELRSRLQTSITAMLQRNSRKSQKSGIGIGKILTLALTGIKKLFSPIMRIFKLITIGIKKIGNLMWKGIKSGLEDIRSGVVNFAKGFGGIIHKIVAKPLENIFKHAKAIVSKVTEVTKSFYKGFAKVGSILGTSIKKAMGHLSDAAKNISGIVSDKVKGIFSRSDKTNDGNKKSSRGLISISRLNGSDFMEGFKSVFAETKARKEKKRIESLQIETVSDRETNELTNIVKDITSSDKSIFHKLTDIVQTIADKINNNKNEEKLNSNIVSNDVTSTISNNVVDNVSNKATDIVSDKSTKTMSNTVGTATSTTTKTASKATTSATKNASKAVGDTLSKLFGKTIGGIASTLLGIFKVVGAILAPVTIIQEGIDLVQDLVGSIFQDGFKPLLNIFTSFNDLIRPIVQTLTDIVTAISETIVSIAKVIMDVISPVIEAIQPIIQSLFDVLKPMLDIVSGVVKIILAPLMGVIQYTVVPIVRHIGNSLQVLLGITQVGMGLIISALGGLLMGVGIIGKIFGASGMYDSGKEMWDMGSSMVTGGWENIKTGISNEIQLVKDVVSGNPTGEEKEETNEKEVKPIPEEKKNINGSIMDGLVAQGDVNHTSNYNSVENNTIYNTYGSGNNGKMNQHNYGSYMNMSERGCGPIALADAYQRRTGNSINPAMLARNMNNLGTYNPKIGTSVGGFIDTGNAMGMNMRAGGVTVQSLKRATPNNPITIIGSGPEYGTRKGNNHYMNVIGTDRAGGVYVSNPLSGRVDRRSISSVVNSSRIGLYGSGDTDSVYEFDENIRLAMQELKDTAAQFLSIFDIKTAEDEMQETVDSQKDKENDVQARLTLGDDYDAKVKLYRDEFQKQFPKADGESDSAYQKRRDAYVAGKLKEESQLIKLNAMETSQAGFDDAVKKSESMSETLKKSHSSTRTNEDYMPSSGSDSSSGEVSLDDSVLKYTDGGMFVSEGGAVLGTGGYTPTITNVDMKDMVDKKSSHSPIHEFFSKTAGDIAYTLDGTWYGNYGGPQDKDGKGSSGVQHKGIDINTNNDASGNIPLYPTTSGVVIRARGGGYNDTKTKTASNGHCGNDVQWIDKAGVYHWYMHMASDPLVKAGDPIEAGKTLLGYIGNTGTSYGSHLHYQVSKQQFADYINPLTYFKYKAPKSTVVASNGAGLKNYKDAMYHEASSGFRPDEVSTNKLFFDTAKKVGMSPEQSAIVMSSAIWENAENIYGNRGLTATANDADGSGARMGLLSWSAGSNVGSTLEEQLAYTYNTYFSEASDDYRGKTRNYNFNPREIYAKNPENTTYLEKFKAAAGKHPLLPENTKYGNHANNDLIEGMGHFEMSAVVPTGLTTDLFSKLMKTAEDAYSWSDKNGYVVNTVYGDQNSDNEYEEATHVSASDMVQAMLSTKDYINPLTGKPGKAGQAKYSDDSGGETYINPLTGKPGTAGRKSASEQPRTGGGGANIDNGLSTHNGDGGYRDSDTRPRTGDGGVNIGSGDYPSLSITGAGDISSYDYKIPPIDQSYTPMFTDEGFGPTIINKYEIRPNDDEQRENLRKILSNTYNVRAERVEELLERIIIILDNVDKSSKKPSENNKSGTSPKLFDDDRIPTQVTRLSRG